MFAVSLDRVTGVSTHGKYFYGGRMLSTKHGTMQEAKERVAEEFKAGYFNHATIWDQAEKTGVERFIGQDWTAER